VFRLITIGAVKFASQLFGPGGVFSINRDAGLPDRFHSAMPRRGGHLMLTSRTTVTALLAVGWLQAVAGAGSIRGQYDLVRPGFGRHEGLSSTSVAGPLDADLRHYLWSQSKITATDFHPHEGRHDIVAPPTYGSRSSDPGSSVTRWSGSGSSGKGSDDGPPIAPVPEPSGVAMAVTGLAALIFAAGKWKAHKV
jgi:hypothetical protein